MDTRIGWQYSIPRGKKKELITCSPGLPIPGIPIGPWGPIGPESPYIKNKLEIQQ